jgi:predicted RNA binding protein YcfA (HicA-like mRNA interferase family)
MKFPLAKDNSSWPFSLGTLGNISGKETARAFESIGWVVRGQVGSHLVLTKPGKRVNLAIPLHREIAIGTLRGLIRTAGLTVDEFLKLL